MAFEIAYSALDRMVHRLAFAAPAVQLAAAGIEASLLSGRFKDVAVGPPVFITALPRAGTTPLLSALSLFPSLAAQTYRDMPFVLAPLLWSRLGGAFRRGGAPRERAHGDGVAIGLDSPEASEEVF